MAKKEECAGCPKAKKGFNEDEIRCSYFGRTPVFDDTPCSYLHPEAKANEIKQDTKKCPECGKEAPIDASKCMYCGLPFLDWQKEAANCDFKTREEILGANKKRRYDPFTKKYIYSTVSDEEFEEMYRNYIVSKHKKSKKRSIPTHLVLFCVLGVGIAIALTSIIITNNKADKKIEDARQEMLNEQRMAEEKRKEEERIRQEEQEREEEERERREKIEEIKMSMEYNLPWMQGTWMWRGHAYVNGYEKMEVEKILVIDGSHITAKENGKIVDQGEISDIDFDESIIHFGNHSYFEFNSNYEKIYRGKRSEGISYRKISGGVSRVRNNSYGSESSSNSRLMNRFRELNEEGRRLVSEVDQYYRTKQAGPWVITDVYRLKQIQDEKIILAQQMGDRDLVMLCQKQKAQTLTALRQMGF